MKILSAMKKWVLSVCLVMFGACCLGALAFHTDKVDASAETAASVTMEWRGLDTSGTTLEYMYIHFAGFNTQTNYDGDANSDYVFQNIKINGVSLYDINNTTDVSDWTWDTFPQVNYSPVQQYRKPYMVISKIQRADCNFAFIRAF